MESRDICVVFGTSQLYVLKMQCNLSQSEKEKFLAKPMKGNIDGLHAGWREYKPVSSGVEQTAEPGPRGRWCGSVFKL